MFNPDDPNSYLQPSPEQGHPVLRGLGYLGVGSAAFAAHRHLLRNRPAYAQNLYRWATKVEDYSPGQILRTFGVSELFSSHLIDQVSIPYYKLADSGGLTHLGAHIQRLLPEIDVMQANGGLDFRRISKTDDALRLAGREDLGIVFRKFGRDTGSSGRFGAELYNTPANLNWSEPLTDLDQLKANWSKWRHSQQPKSYFSKIPAMHDHMPLGFSVQPMHAVRGEAWSAARLGSHLENLHRTGFSLAERVQRMLAEIGVGLPAGSYNKLAHVPFLGSGGLINHLLTKRVLPLAAAATVASYADYLTGHVVSNSLVGIPFRANTLHGDMTDVVPGARGVTDFYSRTVPGPQYGPLALPLLGATTGALLHYRDVLQGAFPLTKDGEAARKSAFRIFAAKNAKADARLLGVFNSKSKVAKGLVIGLAAMLPFVPGMLGSRKSGQELREVYSGEQDVPVRSGRWWDLGSSAFEGGRIKSWRPHWLQLFKTRAERKSLWGTEKEYWKHNPLIHPLRYLRDPYALEERNYKDRPYPVASPALSDIPLVGPLAAATVGKLIKPPVRMHEEDWDGTKYSLYSTRLEPKKGLGAPPPLPESESGLGSALKQETNVGLEFIGLPGFTAKSIWQKMFPNQNIGRDVQFQGSRQMTSYSRRYYERELGAGAFVDPAGGERMFGYSEPFRRFVQREQRSVVQANEISNTMPAWLPNNDYFIDFHSGDPYIKIDQGFARLPGDGYAALHPEVEGLDPEDYPDLVKFKILADVAPYSKEYANYRGRIAAEARFDTGVDIEFQKVLDQVHQTKESVVRTEDRRFTKDVDTLAGTIESATPVAFSLSEYPGRLFRYSSVGMTAADLSAASLGENNQKTREELVTDVGQRQAAQWDYIQRTLSPGTRVEVTVPENSIDRLEEIRAVVEADGDFINQELIDQGLGVYRRDQGGAEAQVLEGVLGRMVGRLGEGLSFEGDSSSLNPVRYLPSPGHTKLWQNRTPLAQYEEEEAVGTRMRRWQRPIHDFLAPYSRQAIHRATGERVLGEDVVERRRLNTLADELQYLRSLQAGGYTNQGSRTAVGSNLFSSPTFIASTLPDRDAHYFGRFLAETDTQEREQILGIVPHEMGEALQAQWAAAQARIARAKGEDQPTIGEGGRLYTDEGLKTYESAHTQLGYGDYQRSSEIAEFFSHNGFAIPDEDSILWSDLVDYEDVKLKIIQQEGRDMHDFGIFEDRAALLWRKPWVDGAVSELTSGGSERVENLRRQVEGLMLASRNRNPNVRASGTPSLVPRGHVRVDVDVDDDQAMLRDMRRNQERYQ